MNKKLTPLPVGNEAAASVDATPVSVTDDLTDFTNDFDAVLERETEEARSTPLADASATESPDATVVDDATQPAQEQPAVAPVATTEQPQGEAPAAEAKPVEAPATTEQPAQPRTYDPTEVFALGDGVELTRDTIVRGLVDGRGWESEATKFRQTFGMTADEAVATWSPYLAQLRDPKKATYLDERFADLNDPDKAQYIADCARYYDERSAESRPQAAAPQRDAEPAYRGDPEARARIAQLESTIQAQRQREAADMVQREVATIFDRYPHLKTNPQVWQSIVNTVHVQQMNGNAAYTLSRAAEDMRSMHMAFAPQQATQPAVAAPVLNGSSGAAPSGSRAKVDLTPKKFNSPEEAVEDWEATAASLGYA